MTIEIAGVATETLDAIANGANGDKIIEKACLIPDCVDDTTTIEIDIRMVLFENDGAYIATPDGLSFKLLDSEYRWICTK